jgi:Methyltransferase domain
VGPRIKQLFGNSLEFDFSPYERSIDLVFVDAAHDYPHGFPDSRTALRLVRPGGVVLWHDFIAHFPGLVHAIIEATAGLPLKLSNGSQCTLRWRLYLRRVSSQRVATAAGDNDINVNSIRLFPIPEAALPVAPIYEQY